MASETLSDLQFALMRALWRVGEGNLSMVQAELEATGTSLAPTTVATMLKRMERKGWVSHRREGRQFIYFANRSQEEMTGSVISRITDSLFGGDVGALLCQLVNSKDVSADELAQVKQMIEAKERSSHGN